MASELIIKNKEAEVDALAKKIEGAQSVILVNYMGLRMADMASLRKELTDFEVEFKIIKNNFIKRALHKLDIDYLDEYLNGANAIAFSNNIVEPAKVLSKYAKDFSFFDMKAGIVEAEYADAALLNELASIPNMEGLLTMVAGGMLQPLQQLAVGLNMLVEGESNFAFAAE